MPRKKGSCDGKNKTNVRGQTRIRGGSTRRTQNRRTTPSLPYTSERDVFHIKCEICGFTSGTTWKLSGVQEPEENFGICLQRRPLYCSWCGSKGYIKIEGWKVRFHSQRDQGGQGLQMGGGQSSRNFDDAQKESGGLYSMEQFEPLSPNQNPLDWYEGTGKIRFADEGDSKLAQPEPVPEKNVQTETIDDYWLSQPWEDNVSESVGEMVSYLSDTSYGGFL